MSALLTPELMMRLAELRQKSRSNTLTIEEAREALKHLRGDRMSAGAGTAKKAAGASLKAQAAAVDTKSLLLKFKG